VGTCQHHGSRGKAAPQAAPRRPPRPPRAARVELSKKSASAHTREVGKYLCYLHTFDLIQRYRRREYAASMSIPLRFVPIAGSHFLLKVTPFFRRYRRASSRVTVVCPRGGLCPARGGELNAAGAVPRQVRDDRDDRRRPGRPGLEECDVYKNGLGKGSDGRASLRGCGTAAGTGAACNRGLTG
jgi:hypothetical protein